MSRLQFPFTTGLAPPGVNALQQLFAQIERRKARDAAAKAETARLKAQNTRAIGDAIGSGVSNIAGAFTQRQLTAEGRQHQFGLEQQRFENRSTLEIGRDERRQEREQNRLYQKQFGMSKDEFDSMADGSREDFERATQQSVDPDRFRAGYFQQVVQRQKAQKQKAEDDTKQRQQLQKAATEQRIAAWSPDPNRVYDPEIVTQMGLLRPQLRELITHPERAVDSKGLPMPPDQVPLEIKSIESELSALRQMSAPKPKFKIENYVKENSFRAEDGTLFFVQPQDGRNVTIKTKTEKGDDGKAKEKELQDALDDARFELKDENFEDLDIITKEQRIQKRAFEILESARTMREAVGSAATNRSALSQRRQAQAGARSAQPLSGIDQSQLQAFRSSISGGGPPTRPVRPQQPQRQQAPAPPHPAIAKIPEDRINQEAVKIVQEAGGTGPPIVIEDLKRSGMNRSELRKSMRVGQIYISRGEAVVWDGKGFIPLEKPT